MRLRALAAATVLLCSAPAAGQSVKNGIEAWQRGEHERAVAVWRPLAEGGDPDAAFNLGQAYRLGRGVRLNLSAAQIWLERAARKDHIDAQATLGVLLFENGDRLAGLRWLKLAAEAGEPWAMLVYGTALFNGDGTTSQPVLGYAYVSRAAAKGVAPAKATLAQMDQVMPAEQRKKGVAIALEKARAARATPNTISAKPLKASSPATPNAQQKPATASASGDWRIQLGAFAQRSSAEALFKRLSANAPIAGRKSFLVVAGPVVRLQVGPFGSRAAATTACATLRLRGQACFPLATK